MTNFDFEKIFDTTDEWITSRTGIKQRHIIPNEQRDSSFAWEYGTRACKIALDRAKLSPDQIDGIICATFTPDYVFPSTACKIQAALGCPNAFAFDLSAACAGFVYGLAVANSFIVSGQAKRILLVGAELVSKTIDWTDRGTAILFGDGAGAVVLEADTSGNRGVCSTFLKSDGSQSDILELPSWGSPRYLRMNGNEVFKCAVRMLREATGSCLKKAGITLEQVDLLIPHQANIRIISAMAEYLKLPMDRVVTNLERYGNTSSASIPIALDEAWNAGRIKPGMTVVFAGIGGGMAVGSAVVKF